MEDVVTPIYDTVSATIPDQSLSLRELMLQFAYIGNDRLEDIVNRGFDGDEDDDLLGVDVGALDLAEVHDRVLYMQEQKVFSRNLHQPLQEQVEEVAVEESAALSQDVV